MKLTDLLSARSKSSTVPVPPGHHALREAVDVGRQAKFSGDLAKARESLDHALAIARRDRVDTTAMMVVVLQRADVLAQMGDFVEARSMIEEMLAAPENDLARGYLLAASAMVALAQQDMTAARSKSEQTLDLARALKASGLEARAQGTLAEVYLSEGNASYAVHLLREALPKLSTVGELELSSAYVGMLGEAMIEARQEAEGMHLIERALTLAEQIGYRRYERRWKTRLGERALAEGRFQDARNYFQRALPQFDPDSGATAGYVETLINLVHACLGGRENVDALGYAQIAVRAAGQVDSPMLTAAAHGARGMALRALGQTADAIPDLQIAAAHEDVSSDTLRTLAAALVESGKPDEGTAVYQRALETAVRSDQPLEIAGVHRDLGLLHAQQGRLHDAIHAWTAALSLFEAQKATAQAARLYCDLGTARRTLGQGARALKDFEQALTLINALDAADLETRGLVLSNAANAYAEHGDAESADAFFTESIQIAKQRGDPLAESTRSGNYGWFLLQLGRPRRAISLLGQGLKLSQEHGLRLQHAVQTDNMGLAYTALGDSATALDYHTRALEEAEALFAPFWIASIQINRADTLMALARPDEARALIDDALAYARSHDQAELLIRALLSSAALALTEQRADDAARALDEALTRAKRADLRRLVAEGLRLRSQQLAMQNAVVEASAVWDEAAKLYSMLHMPQGKMQPEWVKPQ